MKLVKQLLHAMPLPASTRAWIPLLVDVVGYGLASAVALAVDYVTLLLLHQSGINYLVAVAVGFTLGMFVAYALSIRFVFNDSRHFEPWQEFLAFAGVGMAGLLLSVVLMYVLVDFANIAVAIAKLPVTICVFTFNFFARRQMIFWRQSRAEDV
jgi:putative flippase GtrA